MLLLFPVGVMSRSRALLATIFIVVVILKSYMRGYTRHAYVDESYFFKSSLPFSCRGAGLRFFCSVPLFPTKKKGGTDRLIDGDGCRQRRGQAQTDSLAHPSLSRNTHWNFAEISNILHLGCHSNN